MSTGFLSRWKRRIAFVPVRVARWLGDSRAAYAIPVVVLLLLLGATIHDPRFAARPAVVDLNLPSEAAIPQAIPARAIDPGDPVWRFRYAATGTEGRAGIPYWIFRIMPRLFADQFGGRGYDRFGFGPDDQQYYWSRPLPRGMTLSDTRLHVPFLELQVNLKRVSLNCSACHRGEYLDEAGHSHFLDGAPNAVGDLQAFKRFMGRAFADARFTPERVMAEIDRALTQEEHQPPLSTTERVVYTTIVRYLHDGGAPETWMDRRADNGPGRIDPFNAVKFEVIGVPDDGTAATLDFPCIWNQRDEVRPWHHWDGNTADSHARNFGSVIGVGGFSLSVDKPSLTAVGQWIDGLAPPAWPFAAPDAARVAAGRNAYLRACASCHGIYDRAANKVTTVPRGSTYMQVDEHVGTDPERARAFGPGVAAALNDFGDRRHLWPRDAFRAARPGGYLNQPLDGIWARAPYLHVGSVPSMVELLKPPAERVKRFYRGNRHYDATAMGWVWDQAVEAGTGRALVEHRTQDDAGKPIPGNGNAGHDYTVPPEEREALIEYLKTL